MSKPVWADIPIANRNNKWSEFGNVLHTIVIYMAERRTKLPAYDTNTRMTIQLLHCFQHGSSLRKAQLVLTECDAVLPRDVD